MGKDRETVGIIGGGQLARMLIEAATPLDIDIALLAASPDDGAARIWPNVTIGSPDDTATAVEFARNCDVITFDHELVPEPVLIALEQSGTRLAPSANALRIAQNKQRQRELFSSHNLPQPQHRIVATAEKAMDAAADLAYPVIVKAAHGGYDGRGVWTCERESELLPIAMECEARAIVMIIEERVQLERELAVLVARDDRKRTTIYPVVETIQIDGICRQINLSRAHYRSRTAAVSDMARMVAELIGLTGIMALELFETNGQFLINEIATRPHNSGHYSIEALTTSQFEQHLRAILNLPPGSIRMRENAAVTVNILGGRDGVDPRDRIAGALAMIDVHVHLYGKEPRPGRKLGHVTTIGPALNKCADRAWKAVELLTNEARPEQVS